MIGRPPKTPTVVAVGVAWCLLAVFVETWNATHGALLQVVGHDWVPGATWLVAGLIAWRRRPDVVIGRVMVAIGFAWYLNGLAMTPVTFGPSQLFSDLDLSMIAWLAFAYPTGKIGRRYERFYVIVLIGWITLGHLGEVLTFNPPTYLRCGCMRNDMAFFDSPHVYDTWKSIESPVGITLSIGVFGLLIVRYARMSRPARRSTRGLWVGAVFLAAFEILNSAVDSDSLRPSAFLLWDWAKDASYAAVPIAFAVGLVGVRASRGRVGRLIDDLAIEADLQSSLARALADPSIEVLYRVDGSERLLDALGRPRSLPPDGSNRRLTPLTHRGDELGVLVHDPALDEQQELIRSVCAAAGLALANERLAAEVRAQLADVRASRTRIVQAGDAERRRIERNLHDGAQQRLVAMRLNLRLAAAATDDPDLARELEANVAELDDAIAELRSLARGIHPAVLTEGGIAEAVEVLVERTPLPITVDDRLDGRHPPEIEAAAYYVIAESLSNVSKYADATTIRVTMEARDGTLVVEVVDDGVGGADAVAGTGLRGLDDRVAATGGRLIVTSPPGEGTLVRAELPLAVNSESGSS